jgi:hypothetical protein
MNGVFKVRYPGEKTAVYEVSLHPGANAALREQQK